MLPGIKPLWIVCEDGKAYLERFERFLSNEFRFRSALDAETLIAEVGAADGVLLDLDFRHTRPDRLVDEQGETHEALGEEDRRRLSATQGILILRLLRSRGVTVPVVLCADLDADQAAYLRQTLAPVEIAPSLEGLARTAGRMRAVCRS